MNANVFEPAYPLGPPSQIKIKVRLPQSPQDTCLVGVSRESAGGGLNSTISATASSQQSQCVGDGFKVVFLGPKFAVGCLVFLYGR